MPCIINIPDANFKAALLTNNSINTVDDGEITFGEAVAFTGLIDVENLGITDLTGIEAFENITELDVNRNNLTAIDLSNNIALTHLFAWSNSLASIDLSDNTAITNLNLNSNLLGELDVTMLPNLFTLQASSCQLTSLDVTGNSSLSHLIINNNSLTSLDVSQNASLVNLIINDNQITTLSLPTSSTVREVRAFANALSSIDLSGQPDLLKIDLSENNLTNLNIANGSNAALETFNTTSNPDLNCITVDDVVYATANFTNIDDGVRLSAGCDLNQGNDFLTFTPSGASANVSINAGNHTVTVALPVGTDPGLNTPSFTISDGATVTPASGIEQDFSSPVTYTITAEDDVPQEWEVSFITQTTQTLTFPAITDQTYGDDPVTLSATSSAGLTVSYTITEGDDIVRLSGTSLILEGAGDVTIQASQSGSISVQAATSVSRSFTIDVAAATITANSSTSIYGDPLPDLTYTVDGLVGNDEVSDFTTAPTISTTATATSNVGEYPIAVSGAESDDYEFTYVNGTHTIGKAPLTIAAVDASMVYGADIPELEVTFEGFKADDDASALTNAPAVSTTATNASAVGDYTITVDGATATNYEISYMEATLTVTQAVLTLSADDQQITYGSPLPQLTFSLDGLIGDDDATVLTTAPDLSITETDLKAGTYVIAIAGGEASNYTLAYEEGSLNIAKAELVVTADDKSTVFMEGIPELTYTLSGFVADETADIIDQLPALSTTATLASDAGTYEITADGASDDNYNFTYVPGTLMIGKALATIEISDLDQPGTGDPVAPTITTVPAGLATTITYDGSETLPSVPGEYLVLVVIDDINYEGSLEATLEIAEPDPLSVRDVVSIKGYPNPTKGYFQIDMEGQTVVRGTLLSLSGRLIKSFENTHQLELSDVPEGTYVLQVWSNTGALHTLKVIKSD
ncbi:MAG: MBG domain-containing protein [Bacteroidota bacterium]